MKNVLIFAMILAAGTSAYPQATRSARESKSEKGSSRTESSGKSVSRSESRSSNTTKSSVGAVQKSRSADYSQKSATRAAERPTVNRSAQEVRKSVESRSSSQPVRRYEGNTQTRTRQESAVRPEMKSGGSVSRSTNEMRSRDEGAERVKVGNSSSATRVFREGKNTLTREDGKVIRHQNDEVFASRRYKLDFDNYESLRRSDEFRREYRNYDNWYHHRNIRVIHEYHTRYVPIPIEVRRVRYIYRRPVHVDLIWTPLLLHRFMYYYPTHTRWDIDFGNEIETISAYDAMDYAGSVKRVYGKVEEVYYSPEDENYILYIGAPFPYHDVSVVIPKYIAREITGSPKWYFENEHIWVVGLINVWEGKPEIVVRDEDQVRRY